jgi:hypothetical protein
MGKKFIWEYFAFPAIIILGLIITWRDYSRNRTIDASHNWPTAIGKVINSSIEELRDTDGTGPYYYHPVITYRYNVSGENYLCNLGVGIDFYTQAKNTLKSWPIGKEIKVSYNPQSPRECVTAYDGKPSPWIGVFITAIGAILLVILPLKDPLKKRK